MEFKNKKLLMKIFFDIYIIFIFNFLFKFLLIKLYL